MDSARPLIDINHPAQQFINLVDNIKSKVESDGPKTGWLSKDPLKQASRRLANALIRCKEQSKLEDACRPRFTVSQNIYQQVVAIENEIAALISEQEKLERIRENSAQGFEFARTELNAEIENEKIIQTKLVKDAATLAVERELYNAKLKKLKNDLQSFKAKNFCYSLS